MPLGRWSALIRSRPTGVGSFFAAATSTACRVESVESGTLGAESHSDSDLVRPARLTSAAGGAIVAPAGGTGWRRRKRVGVLTLFLGRYVTDSTQNWGRFSEPRVDDLFSQQSRSLDAHERHRLINELQKVVLENTYYITVWLSED